MATRQKKPEDKSKRTMVLISPSGLMECSVCGLQRVAVVSDEGTFSCIKGCKAGEVPKE
jgi:hypothetical protein